MTTAGLAVAFLVGIAQVQPLPLAGIPTEQRTLHGGVQSYEERPADAMAMLRDLNAFRAPRGLPPLRLDPRLCRIALDHAADMAVRKYFGHNSPEGLSPFDRMQRSGYAFGYAGENLVLDRDEPGASRALWQSPEHRDNILESHYAKIGIAAVRTSEGDELFVQDFSD